MLSRCAKSSASHDSTFPQSSRKNWTGSWGIQGDFGLVGIILIRPLNILLFAGVSGVKIFKMVVYMLRYVSARMVRSLFDFFWDFDPTIKCTDSDVLWHNLFSGALPGAGYWGHNFVLICFMIEWWEIVYFRFFFKYWNVFLQVSLWVSIKVKFKSIFVYMPDQWIIQ